MVVDALAEAILSKPIRVMSQGARRFKLGQLDYISSPKALTKNHIESLITASDILESDDLTSWYRLELPDKQKSLSEAITKVLDIHRPEKSKVPTVAPTQMTAHNQELARRIIDGQYIVARAIDEAESQSSFYCIKTGRLVEANFAAGENALLAAGGCKDPKDAKLILKRSSFSYTPYYSPRDEPGPQKDKSGVHYQFNTYIPPAYRDRAWEPAMPPVLEKFFSSFFKTKASRSFAMYFLHHSLTSRANTYLVLRGGQGCGKGMFMRLASCLHGNSNSTTLTGQTAKAQFNFFFGERTIMHIDEFMEKDPKGKDFFKTVINDQMLLDKKNQHQKDTPLRASFILATNYENSVCFEPTERRFSAIDIMEDNLNSTWSEAELSHLHESLEKDEVLGPFAAWLEQYCSAGKYKSTYAFHGHSFERMVYAGQPKAGRFVLDHLFDPEKFKKLSALTYEAFEDQWHKRNKSAHFLTYENFIRLISTFKWKGKYIVKMDGEKILLGKNFKHEKFQAVVPTRENSGEDEEYVESQTDDAIEMADLSGGLK